MSQQTEEPIITNIEDGDVINHSSSYSTTTPSAPTLEQTNTSTNNSSSTHSHHNHDNNENDTWSCNICFDTASEPVVTQCGHLYCWSCIYRWIQSQSNQTLQCPVCKAGIKQEQIIPIYGRGGSNKSTTNNSTNNNNNSTSDSIPNRPRGQYTDSSTTPNPNYNPFSHYSNNFHFSTFHTNSAFYFSDAFQFIPFQNESDDVPSTVRRLSFFFGFIILLLVLFW
ncbi:hypothetical protein ABK040_002873 [Willaertia magna]